MRPYGDYLPFLDREIARIGKGPLLLSFPEALQVLAHPGTAEADAACRVFAATLDWPPMTEGVRLEVCLRLACLRWWCALPEIRRQNDEDEGPESLASVLIEYWRDVGRADWLFDAFVKRSAWSGTRKS